MAGSIARHGPHHSAQKSTRTGVGDFSTLVSKSPSVNVFTCSDAICSSSPFYREARLHRALSAAGIDASSPVDFDIFLCGGRPSVVLRHALPLQPGPRVPVFKEPHGLLHRTDE